jgi:hypothetical protein
VTVSFPSGSELVVQLAWYVPLTSLSAIPVHPEMPEFPELKVTVPPPSSGSTVAVSVVGCPEVTDPDGALTVVALGGIEVCSVRPKMSPLASP